MNLFCFIEMIIFCVILLIILWWRHISSCQAAKSFCPKSMKGIFTILLTRLMLTSDLFLMWTEADSGSALLAQDWFPLRWAGTSCLAQRMSSVQQLYVAACCSLMTWLLIDVIFTEVRDTVTCTQLPGSCSCAVHWPLDGVMIFLMTENKRCSSGCWRLCTVRGEIKFCLS